LLWGLNSSCDFGVECRRIPGFGKKMEFKMSLVVNFGQGATFTAFKEASAVVALSVAQ